MNDRLSLLGLGRMGSALAAALLDANRHVTVWNRTPSKAARLETLGATQASDPADAVAGGDIVIVCVGNYEHSKEALSDCGDLSGKTLIQLTTGTRADSEATQEWAIGKGALYLDGTIAAYPSEIGGEDTVLVVAGSQGAWEAGETVIKTFGGASVYVGTNMAGPIALASAMVVPGLMAMMGMIQGAHVLEQAGIDVGLYAEMIPAMTPLFIESLQRQANAIATNEFTDPEAALGTWAADMNQLADEFSTCAGVDLLGPIRDLLNRAVDAGYEEEELSAVIKILRQSEA